MAESKEVSVEAEGAAMIDLAQQPQQNQDPDHDVYDDLDGCGYAGDGLDPIQDEPDYRQNDEQGEQGVDHANHL